MMRFQTRFFASVEPGFYFTKDHEWFQVTGNGEATVGITNFAQEALGDITYVDLCEEGEDFASGDVVVSLESTKASGDVAAPFDLQVTSVNQDLEDDPERVNRDPLGEGWLFKASFDHSDIEAAFDNEDFLTEEGYEEFLKEHAH
jgi:glycine cleavage system H protein